MNEKEKLEITPVSSVKPINPIMRENAPYFLGMAAICSICFAIAFYKNFIGITFPLITAATLVVCGLFLKKNVISWKKSNWWYVGGCLLLGISTVLTTNGFVIFFNTVGILLMISHRAFKQCRPDFFPGRGKGISQSVEPDSLFPQRISGHPAYDCIQCLADDFVYQYLPSELFKGAGAVVPCHAYGTDGRGGDYSAQTRVWAVSVLHDGCDGVLSDIFLWQAGLLHCKVQYGADGRGNQL